MTKHDLQQYYWAKKNIKRLEDRLFELETVAIKVTTTLSHQPKGTSVSDKSGIIAEIVEVQNEINYQLKRAYGLMAKVEEAIKALPEREACLVRLRYIDCRRWEEICVDMNYSWRQVHRIHGEALEMMA